MHTGYEAMVEADKNNALIVGSVRDFKSAAQTSPKCTN